MNLIVQVDYYMQLSISIASVDIHQQTGPTVRKKPFQRGTCDRLSTRRTADTTSVDAAD